MKRDGLTLIRWLLYAICLMLLNMTITTVMFMSNIRDRDHSAIRVVVVTTTTVPQ